MTTTRSLAIPGVYWATVGVEGALLDPNTPDEEVQAFVEYWFSPWIGAVAQKIVADRREKRGAFASPPEIAE